jgi:hypothetical protein
MRFAICSAVYPEAPGFVSDFFAGVERAARGHPDTELIVAVEHGFEAFDALARDHAKRVPVRADHAPAPTTAPGLRRRMLDAAATCAADIVVFADFDDRLEPEALGLHARALAQAEISYGDMRLADADGAPLGRNFFDGANIPVTVSGPSALVERNFMGFGNSAVRRAALARARLVVPDDAMPADWWVFSALLANGLKARRAEAPVALYRCHANSTLGAMPSATAAMLRQRAIMALGHYDRLSGRVDVREARRAVGHLVDFLDRDDRAWATLAPALAGCPAVWFEDVARASGAVANMTTNIH